MDVEQEDDQPTPPTPLTVARRALVLAVVSCRAFTDQATDDESAARLAADSFAWLRAIGLDEELNEWEKQLLESPFGDLAARDRINASWLSEGVGVLAWALGKHDLPEFDESCDPDQVANSLGFLQPSAETVLADPQLRSTEELEEYNMFVYNLHWRVRDYSLHRKPYDFEALARKAWGQPVLRFGLKLLERDLCVAGVPLFRSQESEWRTFASIVQERHRASNWLLGYESEDFYLVTTDT